MRSSGALPDDLRRRYLRQQIEIGGPELIVSTAAVGTVRDAARQAPVPTAGGPAPAPAAGETAGRIPKWLEGAPPIPGPGLSVALPEVVEHVVALEDLAGVAAHVAGCRRCPLAAGRTHTVPGEGDPAARLMLIGEGPGATEDETGRPFVGRAGELLDSILSAIDLRREEVFIANVVKCRPPNNRKPLPDEMGACLPYLARQIALIRPAVIVALGGTAAEALLGARSSLGALRGTVHRLGGIPLIVTYHPAALLRNPHWKKPTWDDVRIARQLLGD